MRAGILIAGVILGGALFALSRRSEAAIAPDAPVDNGESWGAMWNWLSITQQPVTAPQTPVEYADPYELWGAGSLFDAPQSNIPNNAYTPNLPGAADMNAQNISAFLALIRAVEPNQADPYRSLTGGGFFDDFSDHPYRTGWPGIRRQDDGRLATSAGAYQITVTTWDGGASGKPGVKQALGLTDFSPASQDAAAVELIRRRGALAAVEAGDLMHAIQLLRNEWEAFDKMLAGRYAYTFTDAQRIFATNGGALA